MKKDNLFAMQGSPSFSMNVSYSYNGTAMRMNELSTRPRYKKT